MAKELNPLPADNVVTGNKETGELILNGNVIGWFVMTLGPTNLKRIGNGTENRFSIKTEDRSLPKRNFGEITDTNYVLVSDSKELVKHLIARGFRLEFNVFPVIRINGKPVEKLSVMETFIHGVREHKFSIRGAGVANLADVLEHAAANSIYVDVITEDLATFGETFTLTRNGEGLPVLIVDGHEQSVRTRPIDGARNFLLMEDGMFYYVSGMSLEDEKLIRANLTVALS